MARDRHLPQGSILVWLAPHHHRLAEYLVRLVPHLHRLVGPLICSCRIFIAFRNLSNRYCLRVTSPRITASRKSSSIEASKAMERLFGRDHAKYRMLSHTLLFCRSSRWSARLTEVYSKYTPSTHHSDRFLIFSVLSNLVLTQLCQQCEPISSALGLTRSLLRLSICYSDCFQLVDFASRSGQYSAKYQHQPSP